MRSTRRPNPLPVKEALSAGGVVYQVGESGIEIALVIRNDPPLWALPKGGPHPGETLAQAANREVVEETGLKVELVGELGSIEYWFTSRAESVRYHKTVYHFLFRAIGGSTVDHDHEYDRVEWLPIELATKQLSYENEALMVRRASEFLRQLGKPKGTHG